MAKGTEYKVVTTRNDVNPMKVRINPERLGRASLLPDEEVIVIADSMRTRGQEQPIKARAIEGSDELEAIFGITRTRAGQMIVKGYKDNSGKDIPANPNFKLRVEVIECTDEEAFVSNVVENALRNQCSAIDNAKNQQKLRDEFDMTDAAIGRLYGWSGSALVNRLKKLLTLPEFVQQAIHKGDMSAQAGYLLADAKDIVEANAFEAVWAKVKADGDEEEAGIQTAQMAAAIKEWRKEQKQEAETSAGDTEGTGEAGEGTGEGAAGEGTGEAGEGASNKVTPLSLKQLKDVFKAMAEDEAAPPKTKKLAENVLKLAADEMDAKAFVKAVMKAFDEKPVKVEKKEEAPASEEETQEPLPVPGEEEESKPKSKKRKPVARK